MKNKLSQILGTRLPEYIKYGELGNNFELFLKAYYEFLEQRNSGTGLVNFHSDNIDIDKTLDEFIDKFFSEFGEFIPRDTAHSRKEVLKKLHTLYKEKGTENSVKLFFKLVFGIKPEINYPGNSILKASDGSWEQRLSIRIGVAFNQDLLMSVFQKEIQWDNKVGLQSAIIQEIRKIKENVYDVYFLNKTQYFADIGDSVRILGSNGETLVSAMIRPTPTKINVFKGGKKFKVGQILRLTGNEKDTIVIVKNVDISGSIKNVEILEIGGDYTSDRSYSFSQFPFPIKTDFRLYVDDNGNPAADINDRTSGFIETVTISKDIAGFDPAGYFGEQYLVGDTPYNTAVITSYVNDNTIKEMPTSNLLEITQEEYEQSIALITLKIGAITKHVGRFTTENGQLSNSNIRLQDSLLYQKFSYIISSPILIKKYKQAFLKLVHPAGYKLFSNLNLESLADISSMFKVDIARNLKLILNSDVAATDVVRKQIVSAKSNSIITSENIVKIVTAPKTESLTANENISKSIISAKTETASPEEFIAKSFTEIVSDSTTVVDNGVSLNFSLVTTETINTADNQTKNLTVVNSDTVNATDTQTKSLSKPISDAFTATDTQSINYALITSDTSAATDNQTKNITTITSDSVGPVADTTSFAYSLTDSVTTNETITKSETLRPSDTASATDAINILLTSETYSSTNNYFAEQYAEQGTTSITV